MHSLRRRLEESIRAFKKKHCGPFVILAPHHQHGDGSEETFVLFAPFAMLYIGMLIERRVFGVIYPRFFYLRIVYL